MHDLQITRCAASAALDGLVADPGHRGAILVAVWSR